MLRRFTILSAVSAGLVLGAVAPVLGQVNPFDDTLNLKKSDIVIIKKSAREDLDGKRAGTIVQWSNPETGNTGSVTLLRSFEYEGHECREVQHIVDPKGGGFIQRYVNTICKQDDGSWKS